MGTIKVYPHQSYVHNMFSPSQPCFSTRPTCLHNK